MGSVKTVIEICFLLGMSMDEHQHWSFKNYGDVPCKGTKESQADVTQKIPLKFVKGEPSKEEVKAMNADLWVQNPIAHRVLPQPPVFSNARRYTPRNPYFITRIIKSSNKYLDPFHSRSHFAPYEKRRKPVNLVAFRQKGSYAREAQKAPPLNYSNEVAELQSPFNSISNFWAETSFET